MTTLLIGVESPDKYSELSGETPGIRKVSRSPNTWGEYRGRNLRE